jgi:hypothetical protein
MDNEDLIVWADGTWCYRYELEEMTYMSDDYEVVRFGTGRHEALTEQ